MRILLLTRSFNSLTQRLWVEFARRGHELSLEFDIADSVTEEAVALFAPDLIVAPFLKRAIPESVWCKHVCLIVHPGIEGDRGPSALDWAILDGERQWGVTVLQAEAEMDAGPVWASATFPLRSATKSSLYRNEVTEAAVAAVLQAVERYEAGRYVPRRVEQGAPGVRGRTRPLIKQEARRIDWACDDTATVLRKLRAADGVPGVLDELFGVPVYLFDAHAAAAAQRPHPDPPPLRRGGSFLPPPPAGGGSGVPQSEALRRWSGEALQGRDWAGRGGGGPGTILARCHHAVLRATTDGAVWIGHCKRADLEDGYKLPVAVAFPEQVAALPEIDGYPEITYEEHGPAGARVGVLHFAFYNGAMSTAQCERLRAAIVQALARPTRVLVLAGGPDFFSNGIHLNVIEAAASPADESMRNIEAMDDVCLSILTATDRITVAALQGNAGAGGAFLAFTADEVWARDGVLLNPHYKNMGNLYGSEYWTCTLPRRVRQGEPRAVLEQRLPIDARQANELGLVDEVLPADRAAFMPAVLDRALALAQAPDLAGRIAAKQAQRAADEAAKPLAQYRAEELARMRRNFYGFDSSYHVARSYFVRKTPHSWTPRHLARHRG
ncbi:MAG: enoyl-CoA hydratase-related protein [Betaproteobacteria bacterium]